MFVKNDFFVFEESNLVAPSQEKFLTMPSVNEADFWLKIGTILADKRGLKAYYGIKEETGIDTKTMQSIEAGHPGLVEKLSLYAKYFGLDLVDMFRAVLSEGSVTVEAAEMRRLFTGLRPDGQLAVLHVARTLPPAAADTPSVEPAPPAAPRRQRRRRE